jgi:hypothetical protein
MRKALFLFAVLGLTGSLWAADPFIGTWKLNIAKSKARPGASLPKEQTDICRELDTNQIECVTKSIKDDGSPGTLTMTFPRQGGMVKLQPPEPKFMSYVETIVKPGEWYATFMMNGVQIQLIHKVISEDGKTARATITGVGLDGKPVEEILVFEKQ